MLPRTDVQRGILGARGLAARRSAPAADWAPDLRFAASGEAWEGCRAGTHGGVGRLCRSRVASRGGARSLPPASWLALVAGAATEVAENAQTVAAGAGHHELPLPDCHMAFPAPTLPPVTG